MLNGLGAVGRGRETTFWRRWLRGFVLGLGIRLRAREGDGEGYHLLGEGGYGIGNRIGNRIGVGIAGTWGRLGRMLLLLVG